MKMMIVILGDRDAEPVMQALVDREFRATRIASTGVFLRRGNTTLLIGLEDDLADEALGIIREHTTQPEQADQRRATVFVLPVASFEQL
ncbi:MAG: cyclic-di-AMP receptor [Anaerolineales bacterium]